MLFIVIYSADVPRSERISRFRPPQVRKLWDLTEDDRQYEYGYLEGDWQHGKHRKWWRCSTRTSSSSSFNRLAWWPKHRDARVAFVRPASASMVARNLVSR